VLGYLDDLIITPLGIALALKMIPPDVMYRIGSFNIQPCILHWR